jgi:hypothetical protein
MIGIVRRWSVSPCANWKLKHSRPRDARWFDVLSAVAQDVLAPGFSVAAMLNHVPPTLAKN